MTTYRWCPFSRQIPNVEQTNKQLFFLSNLTYYTFARTYTFCAIARMCVCVCALNRDREQNDIRQIQNLLLFK